MRKEYQKQFHRKTKRRVGRGSAGPEDALQLTLDRCEVMREMQEGLHRFGVTIGLELVALMMKDEVERLCGGRYEHLAERAATCHGQQRGVITSRAKRSSDTVTPAIAGTSGTIAVGAGHGDVNGDGVVTSADVFYLINYLFASGPPPVGSADVNGDGSVTIADIFYLINYLYSGGPAPQ